LLVERDPVLGEPLRVDAERLAQRGHERSELAQLAHQSRQRLAGLGQLVATVARGRGAGAHGHRVHGVGGFGQELSADIEKSRGVGHVCVSWLQQDQGRYSACQTFLHECAPHADLGP
jgi:hypothetical protein